MIVNWHGRTCAHPPALNRTAATTSRRSTAPRIEIGTTIRVRGDIIELEVGRRLVPRTWAGIRAERPSASSGRQAPLQSEIGEVDRLVPRNAPLSMEAAAEQWKSASRSAFGVSHVEAPASLSASASSLRALLSRSATCWSFDMGLLRMRTGWPTSNCSPRLPSIGARCAAPGGQPLQFQIGGCLGDRCLRLWALCTNTPPSPGNEAPPTSSSMMSAARTRMVVRSRCAAPVRAPRRRSCRPGSSAGACAQGAAMPIDDQLALISAPNRSSAAAAPGGTCPNRGSSRSRCRCWTTRRPRPSRRLHSTVKMSPIRIRRGGSAGRSRVGQIDQPDVHRLRKVAHEEQAVVEHLAVKGAMDADRALSHVLQFGEARRSARAS